MVRMSTYIIAFNHIYIKGDKMKKRSMIINLKGIFKKMAYGIMAISLIFTVTYLGAPKYILEKLASTVFASSENGFEIEEIFYLDGGKLIDDMMLYEPKKK